MAAKIDPIDAASTRGASTAAASNRGVSTLHEPRLRSLLWGLCTLVLAFWAQHQLYQDHRIEAALLYAVALLCFAIPFRRQLRLPLVVADQLGGRGGWSLLWRCVPGLLAIGLCILALRTFQQDVEHPTLAAWWMHIASVVLILLFAQLLDWQARHAAATAAMTDDEPGPSRWWQVGAWLVILLTALFFRLWRFETLPFGTWYDEAENGLQALRILRTEDYWPIFVGSIHAPAHYLYLIALFFHFFDISVQSIRLVSVVMGLATVVAAYIAGRELFGRTLGLAVAFVVAVARWNVNFSRIGMYNASTPLFELLTVGFLLRATRRGRYLDFALAGLWLGLGLCFYAAFQLFVGAMILFLLWTSLVQRGFLRRTWAGLLLMIVTAVIVIAPVALYANVKPEVYFARTKGTSIFADKTPLAATPVWLENFCSTPLPAQVSFVSERLPVDWPTYCLRAPLLLENARKHLLMFNYWGDPNGRHNLPGEPMVDNLTAALLALGVGLCLMRFWRPRAMLLLLWLGVMLLGGILSLGFEAPQSLRAIGTQPAVYLLAFVPLYALWQAWLRSGGRPYPQLFVVPLCGLLLWIGYDNFTTYFYRQADDFAVWNAFSTPETIAANLLDDLDNGDNQVEAYVISYFHGHPTLNFQARDVPPYRWLDTTDHLPLDWPADKDIVLITNADSRSIFEEAKRYYPNAIFEEIQPPAGGPTVIYTAYLSRDDLRGVQGLNATYYAGNDWAGAPLLTQKDLTLQFDWATQPPVALPFSVEWVGGLDVHTFGVHQFFLQTPAYAEVYIGEERVMAGTGEQTAGLVLAEGKHTLRVRAVGGSGPFGLSWRTPTAGPEIIPASALYVAPVTSNGLLGKYYPNNDWQGPTALERIDPLLNLYFHITPLPRPYTVEWVGKIAIPQSGNYRFGLESIDEATLTIDGQEITASLLPNEYSEGAIQLESGLHDVRIRYADRTDHTHINFYWVPPFGGQQPVPSEVLFPPQANYERVTLPDVSQLIFSPDAPAPPTVSGLPLGGVVRPVAAGLNQPKGIAVGPDNRIYVADTGNQRVLVLTPDGTVVGELRGPDGFVEPFDIALDPQGQIYVLDPTAERISIFAPDDSYLGDLPADPALVARSRGLHVDRDGRIWIANTPGGKVVALDREGTRLLEVPVWPGEDSQPVDVVVGIDGSIFVTDAGLNKLVQFDASGRRLRAWDIPVANSLDSSHLAVDAAGYLYLSKPEAFLVTQLLPSGELVGDWSAMSPGAPPVKPIGIAVDSSGRVWYVDTLSGTIYVIEPDVG